MKLFELTGEYLPHNETTSMKLAKELYRGAGSDVDKAKKMADSLASQIKENIDAHHKMASMQRVRQGSRVEKRPPSREVPGYQNDQGPRSTFSSVA